MAGPDQPLPYAEVTDEAYAEVAARTFTVEEPHPGTVVLRGPCPRCLAVIDIPIVDFVVSRSFPFAGADAMSSDVGHVESMMCTCEDPHPNRPDGAYGCGAYWVLVVWEQQP
jgi:hypothetical protein